VSRSRITSRILRDANGSRMIWDEKIHANDKPLYDSIQPSFMMFAHEITGFSPRELLA